MERAARPTGIHEVGAQLWGTHFCLFYETREDLIDLLIPYFKSGLDSQEFCLCVASEPVIAEEAERALRQAVPDFQRHLAHGQIEIVSHGHFDPLRVRQGWIHKLEQGVALGYRGMRFAANISWLEKADWSRFAEYEGRLDEAFGKLPILALCAYSLPQLSSADIFDVTCHHRFALARRHGVWERLEGPELQRAHAEIRRLNADLERRVEEGTHQLDTANQQLKMEIAERRRVADELHEHQQLLQLLMENTFEFIRLFDTAGNTVYANPAVERLLGTVPGRFGESSHPEDRDASIQWFQRVLSGNKELLSWRARSQDGQWRWMETQGAVVPYHGKPHVLTVCRDVTERKQAEDAVKESERLLRLVLATLPVGTAVVDRAGDITLANVASKRIWGDMIIPSSERWAKSKGFWHDSGKRIAPAEWASVRALLEGQTSLNELIDIETFDGRQKTIQNSAAPIRDAEGVIVGAVIVNEDVTERVRAEEALRESADRLQHLSRRLLEVQEEERRHLSRELHDEFGQLLATITLHLHAAKSLASDAARPRIEESMALLQRAGEQVRSLALELRPALLDTAGLDATLRWLAEEYQRRTGIGIQVSGYSNDVSGDLAVACFRIVQEALTNAARHARARHVWIELSRSESVLFLTVRDDGVGFDVARTLEQAGTRRTLGLSGMKERVEILGGHLELDSEPERGTRIRVSFPLPEDAIDVTEPGA